MTPILWWMVYCTAVALVLAAGAHALEAGARAAGRGGRHAWLGAMLGSVLIPIASYFRPVEIEAGPARVFDIAPATAAAGDVGPAVDSALPFHPGILMWLAASLLVLGFVAFAYGRLARARSSWTASSVDDVPVLLSDNTGPAALGVLHSAIVLPRWVLSLESRMRTLMLLHEREHVRVWDPRTTLAGVMLAALMPWNVFMWVMLRRLRLAIELDCDARVLARNPDPVRYGAVLLEVGRRRSTGGFALSTLVEPRSQLERRIRLMAEWPGNRKTTRALGLAAVAVLLTGAAYAAQSPLHSPDAIVIVTDTDGALPNGPAAAADAAAADTTRPRLLNREDIAAVFRNQTGVNGSGVMTIFVDTMGRARLEAPKAGAQVDRAMADAQTKLARAMRFSPAMVDGRKVGTWLTFSVTFSDGRVALAQARTAVGAMPGDAPPPPPSLVMPSDVPAPPAPPAPPAQDVPAAPPAPPAQDVPAAPPAPPAQDVPAAKPAPRPPRVVEVKPSGNAPTPKAAPKAPGPPKVMTMPAYSMVRVPEQSAARPGAAAPVRAPDASPNRIDRYEFATMPSDTPPPRGTVPMSPAAQAIAAGPVFIPMTVTPKITNRADVQAAVARHYPPAMREAGIGGTTVMYFLIDSDGTSKKVTLDKSSGYTQLDSAALKVAPTLRFTPAMMQDKAIPIWVQVPIVFSPVKR